MGASTVPPIADVDDDVSHTNCRFASRENDGSALKSNRTDATVTWVGHSTLLIQLDGVTILTDPQWSERAVLSPLPGPNG